MAATVSLTQYKGRRVGNDLARNMLMRAIIILMILPAISLSAQNLSLGDDTEERKAEKEALIKRIDEERNEMVRMQMAQSFGDFKELAGMTYKEYRSGEWMEHVLFKRRQNLNFNIPIPEYSPQPQPVGPSKPTIFHDNPSASAPKSTGYLKRQAQRSRDNVANQVANVLKGNEYTRNNIERMQREAEERRARREEENRRDRELGRREYFQRMGGFHAYNAARDQWMATEGLRYLQEDVHAMDMASIPEAKQDDRLNLMSGSDMADLLKKKDEGVTVEIVFVDRDKERKNKTGISIGQAAQGGGFKVIDLYEDGGYDESSKDLWDYSMSSSDAYITLPTKLRTTPEYKKSLILSKKQLDVEAFFLTSLPGMGCVALFGDSLALLDSENLDVLGWGKGLDVTEVVACGTRTFAKQHEKIIEITLDRTIDVATFDSENFSIYPETDTTLIVNAFALDMAIVMRFNIDRMTYDEILRIPTAIEKICANGKVVLALNGNKIIDIDPSPVLFYQSNGRVNDIAMGPNGLLVATDSQVTLLKTKNDISIFSKEGAKRLWSDGVDIYVLDKKGNLYRYSKNHQL